jgi:hypothetical protein
MRSPAIVLEDVVLVGLRGDGKLLGDGLYNGIPRQTLSVPNSYSSRLSFSLPWDYPFDARLRARTKISVR